MNGKPHMHELQITEDRGGDYVRVTYGDTSKKLSRRWHDSVSEKRIQKAIKQVIARHDAGSVQAVTRAERLKAMTQPVNDRLEKKYLVVDYHHATREPIFSTTQYTVVGPERWGSEVLDDRTHTDLSGV